jgi:hypothetical protein
MMAYLPKDSAENYYGIILGIHQLKNSLANKVPSLKNELEAMLTEITGTNHFGGQDGQRKWLINNQIRRLNGIAKSGTIPEELVTGIINLFANRHRAEHEKEMNYATYMGIFALMAETISFFSSAPMPEKIQAICDGKEPKKERKTTSQTGTNKNYKLGDIGPAGGLVFYDKGNYSNEWRYLEAAPAEYEFSAMFYAHRISADEYKRIKTSEEIGSGKQNTASLIRELYGAEKTAAQLCADLEIHGYKDWFLPSINELRLMIDNLYKKGLGRSYWSSSLSGIGYASVICICGITHPILLKNSSVLHIIQCVRAIRAF